jgi:hypothetical protein
MRVTEGESIGVPRQQAQKTTLNSSQHLGDHHLQVQQAALMMIMTTVRTSQVLKPLILATFQEAVAGLTLETRELQMVGLGNERDGGYVTDDDETFVNALEAESKPSNFAFVSPLGGVLEKHGSVTSFSSRVSAS